MSEIFRMARAGCSGLFRRSWPEGFFLGCLIRAGDRARAIARRKLKLRLGEEFTDRSKGARHLVIVLVGYKPDLWPLTLARIAAFAPADYDVCLLSSGRRLDDLTETASRHGWSYLSTTLNDVSVIQNLAIGKHPAAQYIFKIDEDMFIARGFFQDLLHGHLEVIRQGLHRPGITAPLINVNGYGYIGFLQELGIAGEYQERFGELRQAGDGVRIQHDGEAALWIWQHTLPFDALAGRFSALPYGYSTCPHRFSIGAILFERSFWEKMGGLSVSNHPGGLGHDEEVLCKYCTNTSQVIVVVHNVLAGHFGFGNQNATMNVALDGMRAGLEIRAI